MENIQDIFQGKILRGKQSDLIAWQDVDATDHAEGILRIARSIEPELKQGNEFMRVLSDLSNYFIGKALNPNKGIWISGTVGTGKTFLFDIFKNYTSEILRKNSFKELVYTELLAKYRENEYEAISKFQNSPVLIDDLAAGQIEINHYGNDVNFIDILIDYRYRAFKKYRKLTHVSTNLYPKQFKELVDKRTFSRMQEMFNLIVLDGEDFRAEK